VKLVNYIYVKLSLRLLNLEHLGLLQNTTRSCTVIAATFCEMKSLEQHDAEEIFSLYPHILDRLYRESDKRKRENNNKSSFCNIKVLDNAHVVHKDTIDEVLANEGSIAIKSTGSQIWIERKSISSTRPNLSRIANNLDGNFSGIC